jgi:cytochrome c oxidase assembly protein subunit 15
MSRLDRLRARWPVSPRVHAYAAWSALVLFTLIVISGAAVRLTGSGLGCPEWPRCNGTSVTPSNGHAYIEFSNRMITTPVSIAAVLCLVFALLRRPYRRDFTVLGALLVGLTRALTVAGGVVVVVGTAVTASGPYAGGEGTDDTVSRLGLFGDDTFKTVIMVHARVAAVFGVAAVALWLFARIRGARDLLAPLTAVCVAVAVTGIIGTLQYHVLDYPAWTVWLHVASVCLTWNALIWSSLAAGRSAPVPAETEPPTLPREPATV